MKNEIRKIIIFGVQGSGKGTQAELISRYCGFVYISTGDIFRREIKNKSELGRKILKYLDNGQLVPDSITNTIVRKNISSKKAQNSGFVLDGYPRTLAQAQALAQMTNLTDAVVIEISDSEAIHRLGGRLACKCGLSYHLQYNPPKQARVCDRCGAELFIREDDKPEATKERIKIYHQETKPLLKYYEKKGLLKRVNGKQSIYSVFSDIIHILDLKSCILNTNK